jgi:hypothetical protein
MSRSTSGFSAVIAAIAAVVAMSLGVPVAHAAAAGGRPVIERGSSVETFADEFILDLCGIETTTTLTQHFVGQTFPDGSQQVHVTRTFVSEDPRIPVEKGSGTSFYDAAGVQTVAGTPIHLIGSRGTVLIDAGLVTFADELNVRGPHPSLFVSDLAPYYCPS